ncbi:MAG: histidine kinase [Chitinophagaceae bacterium]|nr:histidine kinase [Chitinophagaceae bacterium]MDB5223805.1 histidine kinase [Chitinophagaceae bacterium]
MDLFINKVSKATQVLISCSLVCFISALCYSMSKYLDYKIVAFILLLTVSIVAVLFDIIPVFITAILSALIWDYFFIPPHFTLQVGSTEDSILLLMYFVIALVNAALTYKIRQIEKIGRAKEEKANTVKLYDTLLNSLSHELRTPIATIIGATDNLQSNNHNLTDKNKEELITEISKASFRLNQQVENLLSMSRLESGFLQPKKDWCDIIEVVYDAVKRIEENNISQKITINVNPDIPFCKLDKAMMEQIIYNLVNNAVQYTKEDNRIDIIAHCHADVLELIVEDNGKGFPEDEISNVFNKFYRLRNTKTGGTGLGLSIVKGFTEALGGTVYLQNLKTGGARFTIHIPVQTSNLKNIKNE